MSERKSPGQIILGGAQAAAFGFAIRLGARLLFLFVAARLFGATLFGAYALAVAVVEVGVTIGGLGTKRTLFKLLDEDRTGRPPVHIVLDAAVAVAGASLALAAIIMVGAALLPGADLASETASAVLVVAPLIAGQALLDLFGAATRWKHRMRYDVIARSLCEPYVAIFAALAAWALGFQSTGLLIGYWAGTLGALAYLLWGVRRCFGSLQIAHYRFSRDEVRAIMRGNALPTFSDFLNGGAARLDLYLVGLLMGEAAAGIYGMARQLRTPIRQVRQSFDGLLAPLIARTLSTSGAVLTGLATASAARLILAIQIPLFVTLAVIGLPLLHWLGPEFATGYWAMLLLAAAETIQGAFGVSDLILLYRRPALVLLVVAAGSAATLAGALILIPSLGVNGAALAALAGTLAGALTRRIALKVHFGISSPLAHSAAPAAAGLAAVGAAVLVFRLLPAASGTTVYGGALAAALLTYAAVLKAWLTIAGDTLALRHFRAE
jgi:O-antigen/teichoic acid export membrane protein